MLEKLNHKDLEDRKGKPLQELCGSLMPLNGILDACFNQWLNICEYRARNCE
jgi:hypothetical protein